MSGPAGISFHCLRRRHLRTQRGAALMLALIALVLGSLYLFLSSTNTASAQIELRRTESNAAVLGQARDALVTWAAQRGYQPGALPCPDTDGDGYADTDVAPADGAVDVGVTPANDVTRHSNPNAGGYCSTAARRIGRLPWRTLGLPDLRDASGERLWYALSNSFRATAAAINSDTQGQLTVLGATPAAGVIAIVVAPGPAIAGQDRSAANLNVVANYLEGENANAPAQPYEDIPTSTDRYESRTRCERADCPGGAFNDQLALVTARDYFPVLEEVVRRRIADTVKPKLVGFFGTWATALAPGTGFYPFAAPFEDQSIGTPGSASDLRRSRNLFIGRTAPLPVDRQTNGLLPVTDDPNLVQWTGATIAKDPAATRPGDVTGACTLLPGAPNTRALCILTVTDTADIRVQGTVSNVARTFALPVDGTTGIVASGGTITQTSFGQVLDPATGTLTVTYRAFVAPGQCLAPGCQVTIDLPLPAYQGLALATDPATGWFIRNGWFRQTYYAVSPAMLPGGTAPCNPLLLPPDPQVCVRVDSFAAAQVVLVLAGMNLPGRPPRVPAATVASVLGDYFELQNGSSPNYLEVPDYVFRGGLRDLTFNDRVVVVAP